MKIAFYAPLKPLGHKNPSGDLVIGRGIVRFLKEQGHTIDLQSTLRARWIYFRPWMWLLLALDFIRCLKKLHKSPPNLWLTYHTYYKAPDLMGPLVCRILGIKYFIFQGIYSTKRKRRLKTILGFYLNRAALIRADHVFTNKLTDLKNLKRIISPPKLSYIKPGIKPDAFKKDESFGKLQRKEWGLESCPVILTAAMFRDDVKTQGLSWLIKCCERLVKLKIRFHLVVAGSGKMKNEVKALAQSHIPGCYTFAGKIGRKDMYRFYSSGDVFAFPGIMESLGMVYLEAQSCCLPVVAFRNGGIPEVVDDNKTGFLVPMYDCKTFSDMLVHLLTKDAVCKQMGRDARNHVKLHHDINSNYKRFEHILNK
ncbi:MAG: glycosyltransferase family 4 protein, partial [Deltaproteobacteria bacterium]|nr:glycosyltransferase family 4 protein [Deltaproteobacteria bacterium]